MKKLALIGYRGAGKTTVAAALARRLACEWVDADQDLEQYYGHTIREIFAAHGEAVFRQWEAERLVALVQGSRRVLALGGGVVLREDNRQVLKQTTVIWLTAPPEVLLTRIQADPTTSGRRPNLTARGGLEEVRQLLAEREPLYRACADFMIDVVGKSADEIAAEIVSLVSL